MHVLDEPVWASLSGPHAGLALRSGAAARYPSEVSPLAGVARFDAAALDELAALVPPGEFMVCFLPPRGELGPAWQIMMPLELIQMVCEKGVVPPVHEPAALAGADVSEMLALVELTRPGPFGPRTIEMGAFVGFREDGRLLAMGGERLHPPGYCEVTGICTHPDARGRGYAEAVVRSVVSGIQARGDVPFLHVAVGSPSEATACAVYERVGFRERTRKRVAVARRTP